MIRRRDVSGAGVLSMYVVLPILRRLSSVLLILVDISPTLEESLLPLCSMVAIIL